MRIVIACVIAVTLIAVSLFLFIACWLIAWVLIGVKEFNRNDVEESEYTGVPYVYGPVRQQIIDEGSYSVMGYIDKLHGDRGLVSERRVGEKERVPEKIRKCKESD